MKPIRAIVVDTKNDLSLKLIGGRIIKVPPKRGVKLGDCVFILYNHVDDQIRDVVLRTELDEATELEEREVEVEDVEIDYEGIFDRLDWEESLG